jgi:hypothetical protein
VEKFVHDENIKLFHKQLAEATDPEKRRVLLKLLAAEHCSFEEAVHTHAGTVVTPEQVLIAVAYGLQTIAPIISDKRTCQAPIGMSQKCRGTKSGHRIGPFEMKEAAD